MSMAASLNLLLFPFTLVKGAICSRVGRPNHLLYFPVVAALYQQHTTEVVPPPAPMPICLV